MSGLATRAYFQGEALNETDPLLASIEEAERRATLIAQPEAAVFGGWTSGCRGRERRCFWVCRRRFAGGGSRSGIARIRSMCAGGAVRRTTSLANPPVLRRCRHLAVDDQSLRAGADHPGRRLHHGANRPGPCFNVTTSREMDRARMVALPFAAAADHLDVCGSCTRCLPSA